MMLRSLMGATKGDPYRAYRSLGLHGNGSNGGTVFTDNSPNAKTLTGFGSAQTSTAQSMFNGSSMLFNGTSSYLTTPDSADFAFGSGDLTIEAFIRPTAVSATQFLCAQWWGSSSLIDNSFGLSIGTGNLFFQYGYGTSSGGFSSAASITAGAWTHVAVCVQSGVARLFIGGVLDANTHTMLGAINNSTKSIVVGAVATSAILLFFGGYMAELWVTKGKAIYTGNFTPPAQSVPNY